jgi:hypothetical protein
MYTIFYERDGTEHQVSIVFAEKQPAMEKNACELLRMGFRVSEYRDPTSASERPLFMTIGAQRRLAWMVSA